MRRRIAAVVIGASLVAAVPGCSRDDRPSAGGGRPAANLAPFVGSGDGTGTTGAIDQAQRRLRAVPGDDAARLYLAQAYLQRAREVGDPTWYTKADSLLRRLPDAPEVLVTRGTLALARHRFAEARELALAAPESEAQLGVLVDADNELGRYDDALDATQRMVDLRPNLAALSRVSYARELRGDLPGAVEAMTQAAAAGGATGENVAYVQVQLGNLLVTTGDLGAAAQAFDSAEVAFPGFPATKVGRAKLLVARGDLAGALPLLSEAVAVQPTAETVILQGDVLTALGRDASRSYALVSAIAALYRANGVNTDLEMALFEADHHPGAASVRQARAALRERPGYLGHQALGWALFRAGDVDAGWKEIRQALALGCRDPLLRYHAAVIAAARHDAATARKHLRLVLAENPRFSAVIDVTPLATSLGLPTP